MRNIREKIKNEELLYAEDLEDFFEEIIKENKLTSIVQYILFQGTEGTGFSINNDTHDYLDMVSKGKHKTLNLFDDIRNI